MEARGGGRRLGRLPPPRRQLPSPGRHLVMALSTPWTILGERPATEPPTTNQDHFNQLQSKQAPGNRDDGVRLHTAADAAGGGLLGADELPDDVLAKIVRSLPWRYRISAAERVSTR